MMPFFAGYPAAFVLVAAVFGLLIGSFLNVVIHRLPKMIGYDDGQPDPTVNLAMPASHCPECGHPIRWYHNIPLMGYLLLRGRCYDCRQPFGSRYVIVEGLTGALFATIAWLYGPTSTCWALWVYSSFMIALSAIDFKWMRLPDRLTLPLLWVGLWFNLSDTLVPLKAAVIGAMAGYLSLWGFYWVIVLVTRREGLGHGDLKLFAAIGAFGGWMILPEAALIGGVVTLVLLGLRRAIFKVSLKAPMAFGPGLAIGGLICLLWHEPLIAWLYGW